MLDFEGDSRIMGDINDVLKSDIAIVFNDKRIFVMQSADVDLVSVKRGRPFWGVGQLSKGCRGEGEE